MNFERIALDRATLLRACCLIAAHPSSIYRWILIGIAAWMPGCGTNQHYGATIHGNVTIAGIPLEEGLITFVPREGTSGTKVSTLVRNGSYHIGTNEGLGSGTFRVEILGLPPGIKAMAEGKQPTMQRSEYREIDEQFNEKSQLECNVVSDVDNVQDFQVHYAKP